MRVYANQITFFLILIYFVLGLHDMDKNINTAISLLYIVIAMTFNILIVHIITFLKEKCL